MAAIPPPPILSITFKRGPDDITKAYFQAPAEEWLTDNLTVLRGYRRISLLLIRLQALWAWFNNWYPPMPSWLGTVDRWTKSCLDIGSIVLLFVVVACAYTIYYLMRMPAVIWYTWKAIPYAWHFLWKEPIQGTSLGTYAVRSIQNNKNPTDRDRDWRFTATWMLRQMNYRRVDSRGNEIFTGDTWEKEQIVDDYGLEPERWKRELRTRTVEYPAAHTRA
jgi:hypothetical protein